MPEMTEKQTRLLPQYPHLIPNIASYPFPKIAKGRRIASVVYKAEGLSAEVFLSGARVYRRENYIAYRDAIGWLIKEQLGGEWDTHRYSFGVRVRFFLGDRRKIDIDNLLKPILDAGTRVVWADDSQVVEVYAIVLREDSNPRVELLVYTIEDFVDYNRYCLYCGKELTAKGLRRKFCSKLCHDNAQRKGSERRCENCGKCFWDGWRNGLRKKARRFCSRTCYNAWLKKHGKEHIENIHKNYLGKEIGEVKPEVDPTRAPLTIIELEEIKL